MIVILFSAKIDSGIGKVGLVFWDKRCGVGRGKWPGWFRKICVMSTTLSTDVTSFPGAFIMELIDLVV